MRKQTSPSSAQSVVEKAQVGVHERYALFLTSLYNCLVCHGACGGHDKLHSILQKQLKHQLHVSSIIQLRYKQRKWLKMPDLKIIVMQLSCVREFKMKPVPLRQEELDRLEGMNDCNLERCE